MNNKQTETKWKSGVGLARRLIRRVLHFGALSLICSSAPAQNLFVASDAAGNISDTAHGNIYEFTPNGVRSTFASGPVGAMAFDMAGNLFVTAGDNIYKFTPSGARTTFASGPAGTPACDSAGNLFVSTADWDFNEFPINGSGKIYRFTPGGKRSTFASVLDLPFAMAFVSAGHLFVASGSTVG